MDVVKFAKVRENPNLVRDMNSKAILENDVNALNKYKEEREQRLKMAKVVQEHDQMKNDVAEIKHLLKELLGKVDK